MNAERSVALIIVDPVAVTSLVPPLVLAECSMPVARQQRHCDFSPVYGAECVQALMRSI
jgi:hypothetical protein